VAEGETAAPAPEPGEDEPARRFKSAADAAAELHEHFGNWTAGLGKYGLQVAFALMAANWALHGANATLLHNPWAKWSMITAVIYLALLLLSMGFMVRESWLRREYADVDKARWAREFRAAADRPSPWPYSAAMERMGNLMAVLHVLGPMLSGALLMISIFAGSPGVPGAGNAGGGTYGGNAGGGTYGESCCAGVGGDVAAIRRSVEAFAASGTADATTIVSGESALAFPGWKILSIGLLLVIGGGGVLLFVKGTNWKAAGASVLTVGGLTCGAGGFALVKEVKIESIFTVKTDKLFDFVRNEIAGLGTTGPERLGFIDRFKLGDERLLETAPGKISAVGESAIVGAMLETWTTKRKDGTNAVLLVIGSTDRLPISGAKRHQFDANVSLARARAESVKNALIEKCSTTNGCAMKDDQVVVLVSGPLHTPTRELSPPATQRDGFPEDRRVDVWVIWTRKPADAARR